LFLCSQLSYDDDGRIVSSFSSQSLLLYAARR